MEDVAVNKRRRWWLAGLLSFLVPGLGQVYNGQETKGLLFHVVLSVWGGFLISLLYYLLKPPITPMNIGIICLLALISLILWILIIFESIRTAKRISSDYTLKRYNRWYIYLLVILIIRLVDFSVQTVIVKNTIVKAYKIPAGSMMPTLLIGDHFICDLSYYHSHNPERGDIVIFKWPMDESKDFIKRIIGIPGDTIQIMNDEVYINNEKLDLMFVGKYRLGQGKEADVYQETLGNISYQILDQSKGYEDFGPFTASEGEYFVMGDNRDNSSDSRHWGMVKRHQIFGRPVFIYFSWGTNTPSWNIFGRLSSIRFSRIGEILTKEDPSVENSSSSRTVKKHRTSTLRRSDIQKSLEDINTPSSQAQVDPHFTDGKAHGVTFSRIKAGSVFAKLGLRNGDIVQSINGSPIKSRDDVLSFYRELRSGSRLSLQINRNGRQKTLSYRLK